MELSLKLSHDQSAAPVDAVRLVSLNASRRFVASLLLSLARFGRLSCKQSFVPMTTQLLFYKNRIASCSLLLAVLLSSCGKPPPQAATDASPAKSAAQSNPTPDLADIDVSVAAIRILNAAHSNGGVILNGECGPRGITEQHLMKAPVTLEPLDKALQEITAKYQNIYWRESPASGVRVAESTAKARLLRVKVREFRLVEDREPDSAMAALWRMPEVAAFLRRNHIRFARHVGAARKVISPPMIVEIKNATVADILDRIASGYRSDPPKVWIYQECNEKKETLIDVQMK
jgi:hypothetical protein